MFLQVQTQNVDALAVQRSRYLQETYAMKQENAHYISRRYHYLITCSFHLQVSERFE